MNGNFIISLDFELYWGVSEKKSLKQYKKNLRNTSDVVSKLLKIFIKYDINATWATVGFLFIKDKMELSNLINNKNFNIPNYSKKNINNYFLIENINNNKKNEIYYFAPSLIKKISKTNGQEICTHTFSHYYTLEEGQNISDFKQDLKLAIEIAKKYNLDIKSIVFPRNQYNKLYLEACYDMGIRSFRGNEKFWIYKPTKKQHSIMRILRLLDSYVNISGDNFFDINSSGSQILNIPSSRFLRPYNSKLKFFEGLRLKRIINEMTKSAKQGLCYHLWWHPHNFGINTIENFFFLEKILEHYLYLNKKYNFQSRNMNQIEKLINK